MLNLTIDLADELNSLQGFMIKKVVIAETTIVIKSTGDVNCDGINDIIIGATGAAPNNRAYAGASYVIFGKIDGLDTINLDSELNNIQGFVIQGAAIGDGSGSAINGGFDINGDGCADFAIGAPYADPNGRTDAGASYVIFGKASGFGTIDLANGLNSNQGFIVQGAAAQDYSGNIISEVGDINNDGFSDIIISATGADYNSRTNAGASYVIFGKASAFNTIDLANGLSSTQGFIVQGAAAGDYSGVSVSKVGDVNGDGYTDFIIGAPYADPNGRINAGASYVVFGKASGFDTIDLANGLNSTQGFVIQGALAGDYSGQSVYEMGDVNGDGYTDIIIGVSKASPNGRINAGASYVIFGQASSFNTIDLINITVSQGFVIQGAAPGDGSGESINGGFDINGDGYEDIIIGAPYADPNSRTNAGASYVIFGKASGFGTIDLANGLNNTQGFIIQGAVAGDYSGRSVYGIGDINDDGFADIIIGASSASPNSRSSAGKCYIIFGKVNGFELLDLQNVLSSLQGFTILGAEATAAIGYSINMAGDINGDGFSDIILSSFRGTHYVVFKEPTITIEGTLNNDLFIATIASENFIGNGGVDTINYINSTKSVIVNLGIGKGYNRYAHNDFYVGITNIIGSNYNDTLIGDDKNNTLEGKGGADVLDGGEGIDAVTYVSSSAAVKIDLSNGTGKDGDAEGDTISNFENIIGSSYDDILIGDGNANNIYGGDGNDEIEGKSGADVLNGGNGIDTLSYTSSSAAVKVYLSTNTVSGGDAEGDVISNFENVIGSSYDDTLAGDGNVNSIHGGDGNDEIEGKGEADVLDGGEGIDTLSYASSSAAVRVYLSTNTVSGGDAEGDIISNFENIIGSSYDDILTGDDNVNSIHGGVGDDEIEGKGGADVLDGGEEIDTISYASSSAAVRVYLSTNTVSGGDAEGDVISNFENIIGSNYNDILVGDDNANNIWAGDGDDYIHGSTGDNLYGQGGTDIFKIIFPLTGSMWIGDFNMSLGEQIDFSSFSQYHNLEDLTLSDISGNIHIALQGGEVILNDVATNQLIAEHFIFSPATENNGQHLSYAAKVGLLSGSGTAIAIGVISSLLYCFDKGIGYFAVQQNAIVSAGATIALTAITNFDSVFGEQNTINGFEWQEYALVYENILNYESDYNTTTMEIVLG